MAFLAVHWWQKEMELEGASLWNSLLLPPSPPSFLCRKWGDEEEEEEEDGVLDESVVVSFVWRLNRYTSYF